MTFVLRISFLIFLMLLQTAVSKAENLNVSQIAIAPRSINWTEEASAPVVYGSWASFDYSQVGHTRIHADTKDWYQNPWSQVNWTSSPTTPNTMRQLVTPPPNSTVKYSSPYYQLAKVDMTPTPKVVQSRTFSTGSAQTALNYTIKVSHGSSQPLDYFIHVYHPKILTGVAAAYTLQPGGPGGSGGTYLYKFPTTASSRASMDVLVDGLPVWSTESTYMYPDGTAGWAWDKLFTKWGTTPVDNGSTKLYIGRLAANTIVRVTLIVHADVKADASQCGTEYGGWNTADTIHCFDLTQTVQLAAGAQIPAVYVYGKYLNTTPILTLPLRLQID
jgi:hypothetical protein